MRRVRQHELLDDDQGSVREIADSLRDLRRINSWFGGVDTTAWMLRKVARHRKLRTVEVLDVAAGDGFVTETAARSLATEGIDARVVVLDRRMSHVRTSESDSAGENRHCVVGDALRLPFRDGAFDVVASGLFVHHLTDGEVIKFVDEALRVSRMAVLINDLNRTTIHLGLVYAGLPLFRSRLTRHDAVASVRQAYTAGELEGLLRRSRATRVEIERRYLYRVASIVWK